MLLSSLNIHCQTIFYLSPFISTCYFTLNRILFVYLILYRYINIYLKILYYIGLQLRHVSFIRKRSKDIILLCTMQRFWDKITKRIIIITLFMYNCGYKTSDFNEIIVFLYKARCKILKNATINLSSSFTVTRIIL